MELKLYNYLKVYIFINNNESINLIYDKKIIDFQYVHVVFYARPYKIVILWFWWRLWYLAKRSLAKQSVADQSNLNIFIIIKRGDDENKRFDQRTTRNGF